MRARTAARASLADYCGPKVTRVVVQTWVVALENACNRAENRWLVGAPLSTFLRAAIMESVSYRVVAVSSDGQRLVFDDALDLNRAEQMRDMLRQWNGNEKIEVEPDVADQTPRLTVEDGDNGETVQMSL
jgi:hypothetical protein